MNQTKVTTTIRIYRLPHKAYWFQFGFFIDVSRELVNIVSIYLLFWRVDIVWEH